MAKRFHRECIFSHALSALLFLLPWQTIYIFQERAMNGVKWEYGTIGLYGTEALLWACVALYLFWYWKKAAFRLRDATFWITSDRVFIFFVLVFFLYCFLAVFWSVDAGIAFQQSMRVVEASLLVCMVTFGPLSARKAMAWFVAGATIQSMLGIWQFLSQSSFSSTLLGMSDHVAWQAGTSIIGTEGGRWLRAYGAFPHPNVFGGYLVFSFFFTCALLRMSHGGHQKIFFVSSVLQCTALFFTFSRSAWIAGLMVAFLHFFIALLRRQRSHALYYASLGIYIALFACMYAPLVHSRIFGGTGNETRSMSERVSGYREAWTVFLRHPWRGVGLGNDTAAMYMLHPNRPGWEYQPVHDVPLLFLSEMGVIGSILFFCVVASYIARYVLPPASGRSRGGTWYAVFSMCTIIPLVLFDHYVFSSYVGLLTLGVFAGILWKRFFYSMAIEASIHAKQH